MKTLGTVIQVGKLGGRGFIVATKHARYVVTAAHCVAKKLPEAVPARVSEEVTYQNFLGPLGGKRQVSAECVFIDPIADIAVFQGPDNQARGLEAQAYEALIERATPFPIGKLHFPRQQLSFREASSDARMLSLTGEWFDCRVTSLGRSLRFEQAAQPVVGGMSGSPIILPDGAAIGVVCTSEENQSGGRDGGPNPMLAANFPGWLLEEASTSVTKPRKPQ